MSTRVVYGIFGEEKNVKILEKLSKQNNDKSIESAKVEVHFAVDMRMLLTRCEEEC